MAFVERRPRGRLRGIVERLWLVEDRAPSVDWEVICPDGTMEIVLHLGDTMHQHTAAGDHLQPRALLVGQMDRPIVIAPSGRMSMVGARFAAGAFRRVLAIPQHRLAHQIVDLESVWGSWTRATLDRLSAAGADDLRLTIFEYALEQLVPVSDGPSERAMRRAVAHLRASAGRTAIDRLAFDMGVSRRQFERRFKDNVGLSPRLFARVLKFQHAFQALGHESGASVAARCGYVDQAHMVREIRRFAGQTPTALAQADGLTTFFR
jgi:AraC-like DNA-binding protein